MFGRGIGTVVLLWAALAAPAGAQAVKPVDEAARDPALVKVRADMIAAVKAKDMAKTLALMAPGIKLSFGAMAGHARFRQMVREDASIWAELLWVLENGGKFEDKRFTAPWTFSAETGDLDPFAAGIVVDEKVSAHARPDKASPVVAEIGRRAVNVADWGAVARQKGPFHTRTGWLTLKLEGGRTGYVEARHVRSAVDYRSIFEKQRGAWRMTVFIAGD